MRTILHAAGLGNARLDMIKPVCDTCRECRAWDPPGHKIMPSISLPMKFNAEGECDLMFYKGNIAFHSIDRAIRLSDGCEVQDKLKGYIARCICHVLGPAARPSSGPLHGR